MQDKSYDIVIIGGGMVGATMAVALASLPLKIAIIEAFPFRSNNQPSYDARSIALAYGSKRIFESLGVWDSIQDEACPIKNIHVSSQGQIGATRLNAEEEGLDALGYVIENRVIGNGLLQKIESLENIELICPAKLVDLTTTQDNTHIVIEKENERLSLNSKLIIGADGANSKVRELLNITANKKEYQQTAIISNVTPGKAHQNIAYERFTPEGPIAVLPMTKKRCSLVFTVDSDSAEETLSLNDAEFITALENRFGFRTGGFTKTSKRFAYPLSLMQIKQHYTDRAVIIGNAAHALHPIAGQGFNLGIRDVSALAEVIADAIKLNKDFGTTDVLKNYEETRKKDQSNVAFITDSLATVFSNKLFPLTKMRSKGLILSDVMPPVKHAMAKHAMGLSGKLPRLSRGLSL